MTTEKTARILAFDGSGRKASINRNVLNHVIAVAREEGAEVTQIDLYSYDIPLYNGDLQSEKGFPEGVLALKKLFKEHDALLIASPEYNASFTPLLKNALDWISRPAEGEKPMEGLSGKVTGLITASGGKFGGIRGIYPLNSYLFSMGLLVLPEIVSIGFYNDAIDESGALKNDNDKNAVARLGKRIAYVAKALK